MIKYPLPLEIVRGRYPVITQEFGDPTRAQWYKDHGVNIDAHNGTDIVIGGGKQSAKDTYGTRLVCPVPHAQFNALWFSGPVSTQGNGVKVQWNDERGTVKMLVWHCSECITQSSYQEKDTLGFIGNSGLTNPAPSIYNVFAGAHLHLGTYVNDVLCNPRDIFDFTKWYVSDFDTSVEKDLPPFTWAIQKIKDAIAAFKK